MKLGALHTVPGTIDVTKAYFAENMPELEIVNIVDETLLKDCMAIGDMPKHVARKMVGYFHNLEESGCDACICLCSSTGVGVKLCRPLIDIPLYRVDEAMGYEAAKTGKNIAIIATSSGTVKPSTKLVEDCVKELGTDAKVDCLYIDEAYKYLLETGDKAKHDEIVEKAIRDAAEKYDCIVLAQVTMKPLKARVSDLKVPVLSSLDCTGPKIIEYLRSLDK